MPRRSLLSPAPSQDRGAGPVRARRHPRRRGAVAVAALTAALLTGAAPAQAATGPIVPVERMNVQQYLGTWRQIADIPQFYETFCEKDTTANYALNPDGTVRVVNTCTGPFGLPIRITGAAKVLDPGTNVRLQVSFLSFFGTPIFPGSDPNYVIIGLAPDYSWAVVGSPNRSTAYVLARTPTLSPAQKAAVIEALTRSGYDACSLTITPQTGGAGARAAFC